MPRKTKEAKQEPVGRVSRFAWVAAIIVGVLVAISFIILPALDGLLRSPIFVFGSYGNRPIEVGTGKSYYEQQIESITEQYRRFGISDLTLFQQSIWREAFNSVSVTYAMLDSMEEVGFSLSPQRLDREILNVGFFSTDGRFDEALYRNTSPEQRSRIRQRVRDGLATEQYVADTLDNLIRSEAYYDFLIDQGREEKNFRYLRLPFSAYPTEELLAFAQTKEGLFKKTPLSRLAFNTEEAAQKALSRLDRQDGSFQDLVGELSSQEGMSLPQGPQGELNRYDLSSYLAEEDADQVLALEEGQYSGIIRSGESWYIFQATGAPLPLNQEDPETLQTLRDYMEREEVGKIEEYLMAIAEDLLIRSRQGKLQEALAEHPQVEIGETGFLPPVYGNNPLYSTAAGNRSKENPLLSQIANSDSFFRDVMPLSSPETLSLPLVLGNQVLLFSYLESRESEVYGNELLRDYNKDQFQKTINGTRQGELQRITLNSPRFKDNFDKVYPRYIRMMTGQ